MPRKKIDRIIGIIFDILWISIIMIMFFALLVNCANLSHQLTLKIINYGTKI